MNKCDVMKYLTWSCVSAPAQWHTPQPQFYQLKCEQQQIRIRVFLNEVLLASETYPIRKATERKMFVKISSK